MRFYNGSHRHWCEIDLHAKTMHVCILDAEGQVLLPKNLEAAPEPFLIFTWYWLADPATCSGGACTWSVSAASCSLTSR